MIYLLDTNTISETTKPRPSRALMSWMKSVDVRHLSISVLTLGEIRKGVEQVRNTVKSHRILRWLEVDLPRDLENRILPVDQEVADKWGYINTGKSLPAIDSLIAATALVHNLKLVTRNTKDFQRIAGLELINPWLT